VLKTVIFSLQVGFSCDFEPVKLSSKVAFDPKHVSKIYFVMCFRCLDRKFDADSKNVLKTVIFLLQVGFTRDFVLDCPFKLCF